MNPNRYKYNGNLVIPFRFPFKRKGKTIGKDKLNRKPDRPKNKTRTK